MQNLYRVANSHTQKTVLDKASRRKLTVLVDLSRIERCFAGRCFRQKICFVCGRLSPRPIRPLKKRNAPRLSRFGYQTMCGFPLLFTRRTQTTKLLLLASDVTIILLQQNRRTFVSANPVAHSTNCRTLCRNRSSANRIGPRVATFSFT